MSQWKALRSWTRKTLFNLGSMQSWVEAGIIAATAPLFTCIGEPIRSLGVRQRRS